MKIRELWEALETDVFRSPSAFGWMLRLARPRPRSSLFIAVEQSSRRRAIFLQLPTSSVPPKKNWPRCRGLETIAHKIGNEVHFGVILKDQLFNDVFTALAEDLTRRIDKANGGPCELAKVFIGQLNRWQKFLATSYDGLSVEQQLGLWGELHFLQSQLLPHLGPNAALGWKGGQGAHQDFQFTNGAFEVKTTLARQPQLIRISSEQQLDSSNWGLLFLHILVLEVREIGGKTLPDLIDSLRADVARDPIASEALEDGLLEYGYHDTHADQYVARSFIPKIGSTYQVKRGFPRIVEKDLPLGVGEVNYGISVVALQPFLVESVAAVVRLRSNNNEI